MKKITLLALGVISISVVSCKKDYVCECTTVVTSTGNGQSSSSTKITKRDISKTSKKNAESICGNSTETTNTYYANSGFSNFVDNGITTCSVK